MALRDLLRDDLSFSSLRIDQQELGKILFIASSTLFLVSLHGFYEVSEVDEDLQELEGDISRASVIVGSDSFNRSLQALEQVNALNLERRIEVVTEGIGAARQTIQSSNQVKNKVTRLKSTYQWLTLASLLGAVSGLVLFLIER